MAGSVNKVILVGNLGADPEIRTQAGDRVANLRRHLGELARQAPRASARKRPNGTAW